MNATDTARKMALGLADVAATAKRFGLTGTMIVLEFMLVAAAQAIVDRATEDQFAEGARIAYRKVKSAVG